MKEAFNRLRENINNLVRSDKPESPTDAIFIYGSLVLFNLWVYTTLAKIPLPYIMEMTGFLVICKGTKVIKDKVTGRTAPTTPEAAQ